MTPATPPEQIDPTRALHAELASARAVLDRLTAEYADLLADPDAIQEDRDATGQLVEDAQRHVAELEQAEARLAAGTYGRCTVCGRAIDPERLRALPDAGTCVTCS